MGEMKCECYCGCKVVAGDTGPDLFGCCTLWFCADCYFDHIEEDAAHDWDNEEDSE